MLEALISHLDRDEARMLTLPKGPLPLLTGIGSVHRELEKLKFPNFLVPRTTQPPRNGWRIWWCALHFTTILPTWRSALWYFNWRGGLFFGGRLSCHNWTWLLKKCHGNCSRSGSRRGICLRNSLSTNWMSSTPYEMMIIWCQSMRLVPWSFLGMLHIWKLIISR